MSPINNHENQPPYNLRFDSDGAGHPQDDAVFNNDTPPEEKSQYQEVAAPKDNTAFENGNPAISKKEVMLRELSDENQREEWYRQAWDNLRRLEKISMNLEHSHIADYVALMGKPRKMVILNFMGGLARGFGFGIGFTLLVAVLLYILRFLVGLNLPVIGDFIAQLVQYVEDARTIRP